MRMTIVLGALASVPAAHALEPSLELGVQAGVHAVDPADQISTSWYAAPKIGFWFVPQAGLELDVGFSTGNAQVPGHGFFATMPTLSFVGNPLANKDVPVQPLLQFGAGATHKRVDGAGVRGEPFAHTRTEAIAHFGAGAIVPIPNTPLHFRLDAKVMLTVWRENDLYTSPFVNFVGTGGLGVKFGLAPDADKDGIPDARDLCPNEPEDFDGFEDADGCPDPDNDGDGIPDVDDQCPDEPEDFDGFEDEDGCPDPDNDGDGVLDEQDQCPNEPGPAETGGCPDSDGDGIADRFDKCPDRAGLAVLGGCPDADGDGLADDDDECPDEVGDAAAFGCPDADGDGIPDHRDACPDEAGPADADRLRHDGCPARVYLGNGVIRLAESVQFARNSDRIAAASRPILDEVGALMRKHPDLTQVVVDYTVTGGDTALAAKRASAIVVYLMDRAKVEPGRVRAEATGGGRVEEIFFRIVGWDEPAAGDTAE